MRETPKILSLATALAALGVPVGLPPMVDSVDPDGAEIVAKAEEATHAEAETSLSGDVELLSFTVQQTSDGIVFPQHSSHVSHSSHASHASSSPGYGVPDVPYVPTPYVPDGPVYPVPVPVPPGGSSPAQTTTAPPANTSDIAAVACARASYGLGVNDIASELQRTFGIAAQDAVNVAAQALTAVLTGGHYCDGSHGG